MNRYSARLVRPLRELEDPVPVLGVEVVDPELRIPQSRAGREAEQALVLRADVQGGAHVVDRVLVHDHRELLDQGPIPGLGLRQPRLDRLELGDVERDTLPELRVTVGVS